MLRNSFQVTVLESKLIRFLAVVILAFGFQGSVASQECDVFELTKTPYRYDPIGAVNYNSGDFLVIWAHELSDLKGTTIEGRVVQDRSDVSKSRIYSRKIPRGLADEYAISFDSQRNRYLVVWMGHGAIPSGVYSRLIAADGKPIGPARLVVSRPGIEPRIVYNPLADEFFVAYGFEEIIMLRLDHDGALIGSPVLMDDPSLFGLTATGIFVDAETSDYLLFWVATETDNLGRFKRTLMLQRIATDASLIGESIRIIRKGKRDFSDPAIAYNEARREFLILIGGKEVSPGIVNLRSVRVDKSGIPLDDPNVIARKSYIWDPAIAYDSNENRYLAVYHRQGKESHMYAKRLGPSGKGTGKEMQLTCDRVSPNNAEVLFDPVHHRFLAFWSVGATRVAATILPAYGTTMERLAK